MVELPPPPETALESEPELAPEPVYPPSGPTAPAYSPKRPARDRRPVIGAAAVLILVLAVGGVGGNALLSSIYSPEGAVTDYFAAQSRGDAGGMVANAIFQPGLNPELFTRSAIESMMNVRQNSDLRNIKVVSSQAIDSSTQSVAVSMTWAGKPHRETYTVRKDNSKSRFLFYHAWRIVIPSVTIHVSLPNQPGKFEVDGITPSASDVSIVQVVEGYHKMTMSATFAYDKTSQVVDAADGSPTATFAPSVNSTVAAEAGTAIRFAFTNCDASQYTGCFDHTYSAPNDGQRWFFDLPGYGKVFWTTYRITLLGDPTSGMTLDVPSDAGTLHASGTCTVTYTIDGSKDYYLAGTWTAVLTLASGSFIAQVAADCSESKA